ncbi:NrsF family protein [Microvirga solisilvae]|uniref:NrsF family protein n=1 Tax=Microvirga solisilvae TaxID=2919498 RepID=UPI001FAFFDCE|nr:DUF1109 domain-containing protein [Microvirga solisilvae]
MKTENLIRALAKDLPDAAAKHRHPPSRQLLIAIGLSGLLVGSMIALLLAPNPHLAHGLILANAVTIAAAVILAALGFYLSLRMLHPEARINMAAFAFPLLVLLIGVAIELMQQPASSWQARLMGQDPLRCFGLVASLSLPILLAAFWVLKRGAPANPSLQGAAAGFMAAGITSTLYVLHCPEPSLLYITAWHVPAILLVAGIGALIGRRWLRW